MTFSKTVCSGVALAMCLPASLARSEERPVPVSVDTDFSGVVPDRAERLEASLRGRGSEGLSLAGVRVVDEAGTQVVFHVRSLVDEEDAVDAVGDYGTHIEVLQDGERMGDVVFTMCRNKGEAELVDCALQGLPKAIALIPVEEVAESEPEPSVEPEVPTENAGAVPLAPLGGLGVAGVVVAALGVGAGVAGGYYIARGEVESDASPNAVDRDDYRPLGVGLLVAGGVGVVAGAAMIAVGVTRTRRKQRERAARVHVDAFPGFAGLRLSGRF